MNKHIILLIDRSYSMKRFMNNILISLNNYIYTLKSIYKNIQSNIFITVVFFTDTLHYVCRLLPLKDIGIFENTNQSYGTTSLYDNIYDILNTFKYNSLNENKLIIISDGEDTSSRIYTKKDVDEIINDLVKNYKWDIINCNTDLTNINIIESDKTKNIEYDINHVDFLFNNLTLF